MKSYILHGDNAALSRSRLRELVGGAKESSLEVVRIDWSQAKSQELQTLSQSQSLLSGRTLVVVENFFLNNKKAAELLKKLDTTGPTSFIFWEPKTVSATNTRGLENFIIQEFKIPTVVFNFLNSLAPGNAKQALKLFVSAKDKDSADFVFTMMARHIRMLIWAKEAPDTLKLPDWQKKGLVAQAARFSAKQLGELHGNLLEIDRENKLSRLPEGLAESLDLLIVGL